MNLISYLLVRPWTDLRAISNSYAARMTILIPLIGYMIIFNENVVRWMNLVKGLDGASEPDMIPARLLFIYFGLCSIAVGAVVYNICCPSEVKQYPSAETYTGDAVENVPMMVRNQYEREMIASPFKSKLEELTSRGYVPEEKWRAFLHIYFEYLNEKHRMARVATVLSYLVGFTLLGLPSIEVFIRVLGIAFGWASRAI